MFLNCRIGNCSLCFSTQGQTREENPLENPLSLSHSLRVYCLFLFRPLTIWKQLVYGQNWSGTSLTVRSRPSHWIQSYIIHYSTYYIIWLHKHHHKSDIHIKLPHVFNRHTYSTSVTHWAKLLTFTKCSAGRDCSISTSTDEEIINLRAPYRQEPRTTHSMTVYVTSLVKSSSVIAHTSICTDIQRTETALLSDPSSST